MTPRRSGDHCSPEPDSFTAAARLSAFLIHSLARKPGEAMDDTDVRLYQRELFPLLDALHSGRLTATFDTLPGGEEAPSPRCSPEIWHVIHFLRGAEFRPGFDAVGKKVREVLGQPPQPIADGEARARRVVSAPRALPWGPGPDAPPPIDPDAPWVRRFARELARGDESYDSALLTVLARLPTDDARERAITDLITARDAHAAQSATRTEGAERAHQRLSAEKSARQTLLETVAALRGQSHKETT